MTSQFTSDSACPCGVLTPGFFAAPDSDSGPCPCPSLPENCLMLHLLAPLDWVCLGG